MNIRDCVVVITGGRRIGRTVARELAARGADLVLSYRGSRQEAEDTAADVRALGRRAVVVKADVSRAEAVPRWRTRRTRRSAGSTCS